MEAEEGLEQRYVVIIHGSSSFNDDLRALTEVEEGLEQSNVVIIHGSSLFNDYSTFTLLRRWRRC